MVLVVGYCGICLIVVTLPFDLRISGCCTAGLLAWVVVS